MTVILVMVLFSFYFFFFVFVSFLYCSSEQGLVIIVLAVTNILAIIAAVGSTLNICNWLDMFYFETRYFSSITVRHDGGKFVEKFPTITKSQGAVSRISAQFTKEVTKRTWELGSTQLNELRLQEFSIRSQRFYETKSSILRTSALEKFLT